MTEKITCLCQLPKEAFVIYGYPNWELIHSFNSPGNQYNPFGEPMKEKTMHLFCFFLLLKCNKGLGYHVSTIIK